MSDLSPLNPAQTGLWLVDPMAEKPQSAAVHNGPGPDKKMTIGHFDAAAALPRDAGILPSSPLYWLYEMGQAALTPARAVADATKLFWKTPANPLAHTTYGKSVAAAAELFE